MEYFKFLPVEITLNILMRVPAESVIECKSVCTNWRSLVRDPSFSKMHLHHHLNHPFADSGKLGFIALSDNGYGYKPKFHHFEYNENHDPSTAPIERIRRINLTSPFKGKGTSIIGSINGLVCLLPYLCFEAQPCICNPITREYVILPEIKIDCDHFKYIYCSFGFGWVSFTDEYKVVGLYTLRETQSVEVYIYTLGGGNGWRNLGKFDLQLCPAPWAYGNFANGALYLVDRNSDMILTFDLAEENFREHVSPPPLPPDSNCDQNVVWVLDGFLLFANCLVVEGAKCYDVWLLKKKNDDHDMTEGKEQCSSVWSKEFRIDRISLFAVTKSGGVLTRVDNSISIYDTKSSTSKRLVDFEELVREVCPHKNTLISLTELGEEDTKIMESVEVENTKSQLQLQLSEDEIPASVLINWLALIITSGQEVQRIPGRVLSIIVSSGKLVF